MKVESKKAYQEVYTILGQMPKEYVDKVPEKMYELIEYARDKKYSPDIDLSKDLTNQNLMNKTISILAVLYYKYWTADEKEKQEMYEFFVKSQKENKKAKQEEIEKEAKKQVEKTIPKKSKSGIDFTSKQCLRSQDSYYQALARGEKVNLKEITEDNVLDSIPDDMPVMTRTEVDPSKFHPVNLNEEVKDDKIAKVQSTYTYNVQKRSMSANDIIRHNRERIAAMNRTQVQLDKEYVPHPNYYPVVIKKKNIFSRFFSFIKNIFK